MEAPKMSRRSSLCEVRELIVMVAWGLRTYTGSLANNGNFALLATNWVVSGVCSQIVTWWIP